MHQANITVLSAGVLARGGGGQHGLRILILLLVIIVIAVIVGWIVYARRVKRRQG